MIYTVDDDAYFFEDEYKGDEFLDEDDEDYDEDYEEEALQDLVDDTDESN